MCTLQEKLSWSGKRELIFLRLLVIVWFLLGASFELGCALDVGGGVEGTNRIPAHPASSPSFVKSVRHEQTQTLRDEMTIVYLA